MLYNDTMYFSISSDAFKPRFYTVKEFYFCAICSESLFVKGKFPSASVIIVYI